MSDPPRRPPEPEARSERGESGGWVKQNRAGRVGEKQKQKRREKAGKARWEIFLSCPRNENLTCERNTWLREDRFNAHELVTLGALKLESQ